MPRVIGAKAVEVKGPRGTFDFLHELSCDNAGACTVAGAFRTRAGDMKLMIAARS